MTSPLHGPLTRYVKLCVVHAQEIREGFPRHRLQRKPLVSDSGMHHGTCVTHVSWCMPGSLTRGGGKNVPGIPGACATRNFTYLARGPLQLKHVGLNEDIRLMLIQNRSQFKCIPDHQRQNVVTCCFDIIWYPKNIKYRQTLLCSN